VSHATRPALPAAGQSGAIAGYRLDGIVGQGSRAVVYLAHDGRARRRVALKVLAPELAGDAGFRTRMIRDSRAATALDHPHIVPVFDADKTDGTLYAAMRYVPGRDARSLLGRHGPLPLGYAWQIIAQVASALDAVHARGLIHRDVRPANILLDDDDAADSAAGGRAYLSDFGMSKAFPPGQVIAADEAGGMLDYLAPEQIEGRALDSRTDLYSLACTGFELLCGAPPFGPDQGSTLMYAHIYADPPAASARRAAVPAAVDSVLATALAKDSADRYPSCGRFAEELRAALGLRPGEPADPPPPAASRSIGPADGPRPARAVLRARPGPKDAQPAAKDQPAAKEAQPAAKETQALPARPGDPDPDPRPHPDPHPHPHPDPHPDVGLGLGPDPDPEPSASRIRVRVRGPVLAVGAAVVVAAAVVSGVALSGRSAPAHPAAATPSPAASSPSPSAASPSAASSPSGPATASQQAAALATLLTSSGAARTALHNAVNQVGSCTNLSGAVNELQAVVNQRAGQYGRASALPASALPDGPQVKSKLIAALGSSLTADRDYLSWARQQLADGCTPTGQSSAYRAAFSASQRADAAKQAFVQVWNPVAARYGIAQESPRDI
jgi:serine/threonine protein kinase